MILCHDHAAVVARNLAAEEHQNGIKKMAPVERGWGGAFAVRRIILGTRLVSPRRRTVEGR